MNAHLLQCGELGGILAKVNMKRPPTNYAELVQICIVGSRFLLICETLGSEMPVTFKFT